MIDILGCGGFWYFCGCETFSLPAVGVRATHCQYSCFMNRPAQFASLALPPVRLWRRALGPLCAIALSLMCCSAAFAQADDDARTRESNNQAGTRPATATRPLARPLERLRRIRFSQTADEDPASEDLRFESIGTPRPFSSHRMSQDSPFMPGPPWLNEPLWIPEPDCVDCEFAGATDSEWKWRLLPRDLIFKSYLAGTKESRISSVWFHDDGLGRQWDSTLGARVGILRFGTGDDFPFYTQGWQLDVEGAATPRLDLVDGRRDLVSSDFRIGVPVTYGRGRYQAKFAYYHLSSHLGDEFLLRTGATRINFVRDVLVWGHSYYVNDWLRTYGEVGYALHTDGGSEPWEFQLGFDLAPPCPTGIHGAPFLAVNAHLREAVDFGGAFVLQTGWAWRQRRGGPLARIGLHYYNGKSSQWEFFNQFEEQLGFGMWYDF